MKKILPLSVLLIVLALCFAVYVSKQNNSKQVVENLLITLFTVEDHTSINAKEISMQYPNDEISKRVKKLMTEDAFEEFAPYRVTALVIHHATRNHFNVEVKNINIKKISKRDDGSIFYSYSGNVKLIFTQKNEERESTVRGNLTVKKINGKWKISSFDGISMGLLFRLMSDYE